MANKIQKIREEVEKIAKSINPFIPDEDGKNSDYEAGKLDAATQILQLIDSLQEEPVSEDLEKAEKEWLTPQLDKSYADYGETKMMELTRFDGYAMLDAIEFGVQWQKAKDEYITEDLGEYINELSKQFPEVSFAKLSRIAVRVAKWQENVFEKNRLAACDRQTKEEAEREQDFCDKIIIGEKRWPTFSDAIEYGIKWQKTHIWHDASEDIPQKLEPLLIDDGVQFVIGDKTCIEKTDKWCYISDILPKED